MATQRGRAGRSSGVLSLTRAGGGGNVGQNQVRAHTPTAGLGGSQELLLPTLSFSFFLTHTSTYTQTPSAALPEQSHVPPFSTFTPYTHNNNESLHSISFIQLSFMPEKVKPTGTSALLDLTKHLHRPTAKL